MYFSKIFMNYNYFCNPSMCTLCNFESVSYYSCNNEQETFITFNLTISLTWLFILKTWIPQSYGIIVF